MYGLFGKGTAVCSALLSRAVAASRPFLSLMPPLLEWQLSFAGLHTCAGLVLRLQHTQGPSSARRLEALRLERAICCRP